MPHSAIRISEDLRSSECLYICYNSDTKSDKSNGGKHGHPNVAPVVDGFGKAAKLTFLLLNDRRNNNVSADDLPVTESVLKLLDCLFFLVVAKRAGSFLTSRYLAGRFLDRFPIAEHVLKLCNFLGNGFIADRAGCML